MDGKHKPSEGSDRSMGRSDAPPAGCLCFMRWTTVFHDDGVKVKSIGQCIPCGFVAVLCEEEICHPVSGAFRWLRLRCRVREIPQVYVLRPGYRTRGSAPSRYLPQISSIDDAALHTNLPCPALLWSMEPRSRTVNRIHCYSSGDIHCYSSGPRRICSGGVESVYCSLLAGEAFVRLIMTMCCGWSGRGHGVVPRLWHRISSFLWSLRAPLIC